MTHAVLIARWHGAFQHLMSCDLHALYALHTQSKCSAGVPCTQYIRSTYAVHTCMCHADQADHCDKDSIAIVTASLVNDVHSVLTSLSGSSSRPLPIPQIPSEAMQAVKSVKPDSIVLVSHSAGAVTAVDMLAGKLYWPSPVPAVALYCLSTPSVALSCPLLLSNASPFFSFFFFFFFFQLDPLTFCNAFRGLW